MAVSQTTEADEAATEPAGAEMRVDTRFTPIYRFLRVLVHGLNRLLLPDHGRGCRPGPGHGPGDHRPGAPLLHRLLRGLRGHRPEAPLHGQGQPVEERLLARILPAVGAFPVHRESADREALRRAQQVLEAGEVLILFPEGERRSGPVVEDLHEGVAFLAARTGATVVPVGIGGSASVMPKGKRLPRPRHIHLVVGEPIAAAGPHRRGPHLAEPDPPAHRGADRVDPGPLRPVGGRHRTLLRRLTGRVDRDRAGSGALAVLLHDPEPGGPDDPAVLQPEHQVAALLRGARGPRVPDRGLLGDPPAPAGRGDHHLGRLVLVLDQVGDDVVEQLDLEGPVAVGGIGQALGEMALRIQA